MFSRVAFIDFDGCVNTPTLFRAQAIKGIAKASDLFIFDPQLVENITKVFIAYPDLVGVISSSWRNFLELEKIKEMFPSFKIIDKTGKGNSRGLEIRTWLNNNPTTKFVIIDDSVFDMYEQHRPFIVHVDEQVGFTAEDSDKAIDILR